MWLRAHSVSWGGHKCPRVREDAEAPTQTTFLHSMLSVQLNYLLPPHVSVVSIFWHFIVLLEQQSADRRICGGERRSEGFWPDLNEGSCDYTVMGSFFIWLFLTWFFFFRAFPVHFDLYKCSALFFWNFTYTPLFIGQPGRKKCPHWD